MAIDGTIQASAVPAIPAAVPQGGATTHPGFFRSLLSDLNPLQYIPVVGPIYRAITGDEGNPDLRFVASLGTSFALGGPVGVGITVAEKVTGIDPESIGRHLLNRLFHPAAKPATGAATPSSTATSTPAQPATRQPATVRPASGTDGTALANALPAGQSPGQSGARAWTADELTAYGVKRTADNTLVAGGLSSADVLNTLELHRLSTTTRYA